MVPPEGIGLDEYGCFDSTLIGMPEDQPYAWECIDAKYCRFWFGYAYYAYIVPDWTMEAFVGWYDGSGDGTLDTYSTCLGAWGIQGCTRDTTKTCEYFKNEINQGRVGYDSVYRQLGNIDCGLSLVSAGLGGVAILIAPPTWPWAVPVAVGGTGLGLLSIGRECL